MKTPNNRRPTLDELIEDAEKQRQKRYRDSAHQICLEVGIGPQEHCIWPYLHGEQCGDNLNATVRWLKEHLGDSDILRDSPDLEDCTSAFRRELHNKIPTNYWGDQA